jgi:hypothetical protein
VGLTISEGSLLSETVRRANENRWGTRVINLVGSLTDVNADDGEGGGLLQRIWGGLTKLAGFASSVVFGDKEISFSAIWGWITNKLQELWYFDWNQSDEELKQSIQSYNIQIASTWGGVVGQGLGYVASIGLGAGVSLFIPVIGGKALAASILASSGKEALEELAGSIWAAIGITVNATIAKTLLGAYINFRSWLKNQPKEVLGKWLPDKAVNWIKNEWGNKDAPELSFASIVDAKVEQIKNPITRAFVEELLEESWDGFVEGGYMVTGEMDAALARYRAASQQERSRVIEVQPDRENPDERLVFYGDDRDLIPAVQTSLNVYQLIHSRDIGFMDEALEIIPAPIRQGRTLKIYLYNQPRPPFVREGKSRRLRKIAIPNPKPSLTWKDIKNACGAESGLTFGSKYYATARMESRRKMVVYGSSEEEAIANLRRLADLSESEILDIRPGNVASSKQKILPPEQYWGSYMHVSLEIANAGTQEDIEGKKFATVRERIKLFTPNAPSELSTSSIYQHLRNRLP